MSYVNRFFGNESIKEYNEVNFNPYLKLFLAYMRLYLMADLMSSLTRLFPDRKIYDRFLLGIVQIMKIQIYFQESVLVR